MSVAWVEAFRLAARGYCRVSNREKRVARIDREDWLEFMADAGFTEIAFWLDTPREENWMRNALGDHYRRCYSRDKLVVGEAVYRLMPPSRSGGVEPGYVA